MSVSLDLLMLMCFLFGVFTTASIVTLSMVCGMLFGYYKAKMQHG